MGLFSPTNGDESQANDPITEIQLRAQKYDFIEDVKRLGDGVIGVKMAPGNAFPRKLDKALGTWFTLTGKRREGVYTLWVFELDA